MKQTSIKSDRVAELLERITARTGETKVEAVTRALEERSEALRGDADSAERTLQWLRAAVWSDLPEDRRHAPTKEEQEELLGF